MSYCFSKLPFTFPEVLSFYLLSCLISKNAFLLADYTFFSSCSELFREIVFALFLFCFLLKLTYLWWLASCLNLYSSKKQASTPPVDIIMSYFIDFESVNSIWYKFKQGLHVFKKTVVLEKSREQKNWLLHYCRNEVICYFSKYLKN